MPEGEVASPGLEDDNFQAMPRFMPVRQLAHGSRSPLRDNFHAVLRVMPVGDLLPEEARCSRSCRSSICARMCSGSTMPSGFRL